MKLWRKCKSRGGFSLAECLVALLILTIMSSVACMGITTALQDRAKAIAVADAQSVAATAAQAVGDQIRYGQISAVDPDYIELTSSTYGDQVKLCLDSQGHLVAEDTSGTQYALLGEKAYGGLTLDGLSFTANMGGEPDELKSVDIKLSVAGESGQLWSLDYTVSPINSRMI